MLFLTGLTDLKLHFTIRFISEVLEKASWNYQSILLKDSTKAGGIKHKAEIG